MFNKFNLDDVSDKELEELRTSLEKGDPILMAVEIEQSRREQSENSSC